MTAALQNALVTYADGGGGVLGMHHALYNDIEGPLNKDILVNQLFGAQSAQAGWAGSLQYFNLFSTNYGHFISTYGLTFDEALQAPGNWFGNLPPLGANLNYSRYQSFPIYDEIYDNLVFIPGQTFGEGVNDITPIFSNDETPAVQSHTAGFVKLFDPSMDGSIGRVAYYAPGERKENIAVNHSYGQVIRNTVVWLANAATVVSLPSSPVNLVAQNITETSFEITWVASSGEIPTTHDVFLDGVLAIDNTPNATELIAGLAPGTTYSVTISAIDGSGNTSPMSSALEVETLAAADSLSQFNDEFEDSTTLANWQRNYQTENWAQDQLELLDIDVAHNGALTMVPHSVVTWQDRLGPIVYKSISGDFIITTEVTVTNRLGDGPPSTFYSLAGPIVRWPQAEGYDAQTDFAGGQQTLFRLGLGTTTSAQYFSSNFTNNSLSTPNSAFAGSDTAEIRLARIETMLIALCRIPGGEWQVWDSYNWPGMPDVVQVGLAAQTDWAGATSQSVFDHNNSVFAGNPDLDVRFAYVRFNEPAVPAPLIGVDLTTVSEAELLAFLGFDSQPATSDTDPPAVPTNLIVLDVSQTSLNLDWDDTIDAESPPVTYTLFQDGVEIQSGIASASTTVGGLDPDTLYSFGVSATDAVGNTSAISTTLDVATLPAPIGVDPLSSLNDEFDDSAAVSDWNRLYQAENWGADPLVNHDINTSNAGAITMVPSAST